MYNKIDLDDKIYSNAGILASINSRTDSWHVQKILKPHFLTDIDNSFQEVIHGL